MVDVAQVPDSDECTAAQPDEPRALRSVAVSVAREVADRVRHVRQHAVHSVGTKSSETDVVTAGDTEAEGLARQLLNRARPGEPVLGEERGGTGETAGSVCWVIDPIDGTVNYVYGFPWFAVSVAAQRDGASLAGAVVQAPGGWCFSAAAGAGADLDGTPLHVRDCPSLELALLGTGFGYRAARRARQANMIAAMLPRVRDIRRSGSAALDLCAVASGWLDAYAEHGLSRWDWAAGGLIAREAGAVVRLPDGARDDGLGDMTVAASPAVADGLIELLRDSGAAGV